MMLLLLILPLLLYQKIKCRESCPERGVGQGLGPALITVAPGNMTFIIMIT